jgi:transposase
VRLDPARMCELLVGLPEVVVLVIDEVTHGPPRVHVETAGERPGCTGCGVFAQVRDRPVVELVDLPVFGRAARLLWHKRRWGCPEVSGPNGSWTEEDLAIAAPRMARFCSMVRCGVICISSDRSTKCDRLTDSLQ